MSMIFWAITMKMKRSPKLLLLPLPLLLFIIVTLLLWSDQTWAQTVTIPTSHDAFIDANNPTTNFNVQRLEVTYSNFPSFVATRQSLLQFDLAEVTSVVDQSRLVLEIVENNLSTGAEVDLGLYATDDAWDETSITYNTRPALGPLLQTLTITAGLTGTVLFDDSSVGIYIEGERNGDGLVSFLLHLDGGSGSLGFGGNLLFEDREGTHDGVNGNEPFIDLHPEDDSSYWLFLPLIVK